MLTKEFIPKFLMKNQCTHVFGMSGANIEDLFSEIQKTEINITLAKNEYNAAMMAIGYYQKKRRPGFVLTTSGGAVFNTIPVLAEAYATYNPLFLIAGQPPIQLEGKGAFQDTSGLVNTINLVDTLNTVTAKTHKLKCSDDLNQVLTELYSTALHEKRPVALLIPKDLYSETITNTNCEEIIYRDDSKISEEQKETLHQFLSSAKYPMIIIGDELEKDLAKKPILNMAKEYNARIACVPTMKGCFAHHCSYFLGVTGMMGHSETDHYLQKADSILFLGVSFDLLSRFGFEKNLTHKKIISIGQRENFIFQDHLNFNLNPNYAIQHFDIPFQDLNILRPQDSFPSNNEYGLKNIMLKIDSIIRKGDDLFIDAGNTGATAVHYLKYKGDGVFYISLGMGGMGNSLGAAIGSCISSQNTTYCIMGDGSFLMYGLEIHTALEKQLPIIFIIVNNNSHGMCSTREELFLNKRTGLNDFKPSYYANGLKIMFPNLLAYEIESMIGLNHALEQIEHNQGPTLLSITVNNNELPPFKNFIKNN